MAKKSLEPKEGEVVYTSFENGETTQVIGEGATTVSVSDLPEIEKEAAEVDKAGAEKSEAAAAKAAKAAAKDEDK